MFKVVGPAEHQGQQQREEVSFLHISIKKVGLLRPS
jgi:hypothetical protein